MELLDQKRLRPQIIYSLNMHDVPQEKNQHNAGFINNSFISIMLHKIQ